MTSLEGWGSTIELRPRNGGRPQVRPGRQGVAYRLRPGRRTARRAVRPAIGGIGDFQVAGPARVALVLHGDVADLPNRPEQAHGKRVTVKLLGLNIFISTKPYQWH